MKIMQVSTTIVSNGLADGPSQALRDYLNAHKAKQVTMITHPLVAGTKSGHIVARY